MKNYIQYLTIGALLMGSLTSCNDFLDREPLDKVTPEKFFSAEADLAAYAINNYKFVTVDDKYGINLFGKDNDTDNQASGTSNSFWIPGEKKVAADRGEWKWEDIRSCNYFFDQVLPRYEEGAITGNQDNVKHYIGEMYVNRAYSYFQLFTKFGDLPIVTTALPDAKMLVICISVSWAVLEWYLNHDFIVENKNLSSCKSAYYVLYKCCFLLFSQVTYQYTFVI